MTFYSSLQCIAYQFKLTVDIAKYITRGFKFLTHFTSCSCNCSYQDFTISWDVCMFVHVINPYIMLYSLCDLPQPVTTIIHWSMSVQCLTWPGLLAIATVMSYYSHSIDYDCHGLRWVSSDCRLYYISGETLLKREILCVQLCDRNTTCWRFN